MAGAALLIAVDPDLYHRSVQEDEVLEWVTFWSFSCAGVIYGMASIAAHRSSPRWPWFLAGLTLFCFLVALEEISWGQRLLGYRPPAYFLAENFQQELNLHNTLGDALRQNGFLLIVWGYGVLLPFSQAVPVLRSWAKALGIVAPPLALTPAFAATAILYQVYPWTHSGEWAEAMLGSCMLFVAVIQFGERGGQKAPRSAGSLGRSLVVVWLLTSLLGVVSARLGWLLSAHDPERIAFARIELDALGRDIAAARTRTRCGLHKRVYSMVEAYQQQHLFSGEFSALESMGLPEQRAQYFLDPWNSPYWIQHVCSKDHRQRAIFVYSFGPNRMRDSTDWEILEDDLGAWISRPRPTTSD